MDASRSGTLALFLLLAAAVASSGENAFPEDDSLPWDSIGLYIGIDDYPNAPKLEGCILDMELLRATLRDRFGVRRWALLRDREATREGIGAACRALVAQAKEARSRLPAERSLSVVIGYSGHGGLVPDRSADERTFEDSTWVAYDSTTRMGRNDVLDDDIDDLVAALCAAGARVTLISDSCHSGTIDRDVFSGQGRGLARIDASEAPRTPPERPLFPEFAALPRGAATTFSACKDMEVAWPFRAGGGVAHGRWIYSLLHVLRRVPKAVTNEELYDLASIYFARRWQDQTPQFHAAPEHARQFFLTDRPTPDHGNILPYSTRGKIVRIDRGSLHGIALGTLVKFHRDVADLEEGGAPLATGRVTRLEPALADVQIESEPMPDESAKVRVDAVGIVDFAVGIERPFPDAMEQELRRLAEAGRLVLATEGTPCDVLLSVDAEGKALTVRTPGSHVPLLTIAGDDPAAASRALVEALLPLARATRLLGLERNEGMIEVEVGAVEANGESVDRPTSGGIVRLRDGDDFVLRIRNRTRYLLYPSVLVFTAAGGVGARPRDAALLYPAQRVRSEPIRERGLWTYRVHVDAEQAQERYWIKVIATDNPLLDLRPLLGPARPAPSGDAPAATRGTDPLADLLGDLAYGGAGLLDHMRATTPANTYWVTGSLVVDVVR